MSADTLSTKSRNFYERAIYKLFLSLCFAGFSMLALGFTAVFGGISKATSIYMDDTQDYLKDANEALTTGAGFATFFMFCAFVFSVAAAFYISPHMSGSPKEVTTIKTPIDVDASA